MFKRRAKLKYYPWNNLTIQSGFSLGVKEALNKVFDNTNTTAIFGIVQDSMRINSALGFHFTVGFNPDTDISEIELFVKDVSFAYTMKTLPFLQNYDINNRKIQLNINDIIDKEFTGSNDGMTEISPISADLGSVSTPNTKSKFAATNTQSESRDTLDNRMKVLDINRDDYNNISNYLQSIYSKLIKERTQIL